MLEEFLEIIKEFHIKEISLHFYLNEKVVTNYYETYQIIRYPISNYMSIYTNSKGIGKKYIICADSP
jgi:hypothetical protein